MQGFNSSALRGNQTPRPYDYKTTSKVATTEPETVATADDLDLSCMPTKIHP